MNVNKPCCIDIYHGNEVSDSPTPLAGLDRAKASGIFILIHKATQGTGTTDQRYDARRAKWMAGPAIPVTDTDGARLSLPPLWGAYHFNNGQDAAAEARHFLAMSRLGSGDMPFLDWEEVGASGFQPSIEFADAFCSAVEDALGRVCGVYGGNVPRERFSAERASSEVLERFSRRPLWFCSYGRTLAALPEPWKPAGRPFLWQDDGDNSGPGPHTVPGLTGYCDNSTVCDPDTFASMHSAWLTLTGAQKVEGVAVKEAPAHHPVLSLEDFEVKVEAELAMIRGQLATKKDI